MSYSCPIGVLRYRDILRRALSVGVEIRERCLVAGPYSLSSSPVWYRNSKRLEFRYRERLLFTASFPPTREVEQE